MRIDAGEGELALAELEMPLDLDGLIPGEGPWEVELGFGKGRYLLRRAAESPRRRFLGIEVARRYHRQFCRRVRRRGLTNVVAIRGEALYVLAAVLPPAFAQAIHVYFPDPWPKSRHHKRRLFDPETVDLTLSLLLSGGCLYVATDYREYGEAVAEILEAHPGLSLNRRSTPWEDGPRTNYEAKYERQRRPILRLEATLERDGVGPVLHPAGAPGVLVACKVEPQQSEVPPAPAVDFHRL